MIKNYLIVCKICLKVTQKLGVVVYAGGLKSLCLGQDGLTIIPAHITIDVKFCKNLGIQLKFMENYFFGII